MTAFGLLARGDLYWVDLGRIVSSAPAKRRPVVVVQADEYNRSRLSTVVVAAVTSHTSLAAYPGNLFLPAAVTGLSRDSVVNVKALTTVDRRELIERIGDIPAYLRPQLDDGLRQVLGL